MSLTRAQLPVRLTPLVGRERELDDIVRALQRNRLITLSGPGAGTGPDGEEIKYQGNGCAVVRAQPDGTWRIAADAWHLGTELPLGQTRRPFGSKGFV